jgi:nucleoside-diphosphate-sugar epimerase
MNILILGGNRYFGRKVAQKLLKNNKNKLILINRGNIKNISKNKNLTIFNIDRNNPKLKKFLKNKKIDIVFDNNAYKVKDVKFILNILNRRIKKYIFSSSVMCNLYDSSIPKKKKIINSYSKQELEYSQAKFEIENFIKRQKKIDYIILRIHHVFGKKDFSGKTQQTLFANSQILKKFNIKANDYFQYIFIDDLVKIIESLILNNNKKNFVINIANKPIPVYKFYNLVKLLKKKYRFKKYQSFIYPDIKKFPIVRNLVVNEKILNNFVSVKLSDTKNILLKLL